MDVGDGEIPQPAEEPNPSQPPTTGVGANTIAIARRAAEADMNRDRSPTPPRALFRSTTGKGVAFTDEDVTFLVRFLQYRHRTQSGKVDMVAFWKDVATKVNSMLTHLFFCSDFGVIGPTSLKSIMDEVLPTPQARVEPL